MPRESMEVIVARLDERMKGLEERVDSQTKALWAVAGSVIAGVIVYLVTVVLVASS